jgi:hypothetical protein
MGISYNATVIGGFWPTNGVNAIAGVGKLGDIRVIAQAFQASPALRAIAKALNGVVPGSPAVATQKGIEPSTELGGVRNIITETFINRNTVVADQTDFTALYNYGDLDPAVVVVNLDQNPLGTR